MASRNFGMSDGRAFTSWASSSSMNRSLAKQLGARDEDEYRKLLQARAHSIQYTMHGAAGQAPRPPALGALLPDLPGAGDTRPQHAAPGQFPTILGWH